jgi:hypothetical protein
MNLNVRGVISSTVCPSDSLQYLSSDIAILTKHKLAPKYFNYLNSIDPNYFAFS